MSRGGKTSGLNTSAGHLALGTVFVLAGQSVFVVCGYVLHAYLGHAVDATTYGMYGVVMAVLTWTQNALNNGVPWAVRKFLPADPDVPGYAIPPTKLWAGMSMKPPELGGRSR